VFELDAKEPLLPKLEFELDALDPNPELEPKLELEPELELDPKLEVDPNPELLPDPEFAPPFVPCTPSGFLFFTLESTSAPFGSACSRRQSSLPVKGSLNR
jgi:hypothetical protein